MIMKPIPLMLFFSMLLCCNTYGQRLSLGLFAETMTDPLELVSHELTPVFRGNLLEKQQYSQELLDHFNTYHNHENDMFLFGLKADYEFVKKDSSRFFFGLGGKLGLANVEHNRISAYEGEVYPEWLNLDQNVESDLFDYLVGLNGKVDYRLKKHFVVSLQIESSLAFISTKDVKPQTLSGKFNQQVSYRAKYLRNTFDLLCRYSVGIFNIYIGPRYYYGKIWSELDLRYSPMDSDIEHGDIYKSELETKTPLFILLGFQVAMGNKLSFRGQTYFGPDSFNLMASVQYSIF